MSFRLDDATYYTWALGYCHCLILHGGPGDVMEWLQGWAPGRGWTDEEINDFYYNELGLEDE